MRLGLAFACLHCPRALSVHGRLPRPRLHLDLEDYYQETFNDRVLSLSPTPSVGGERGTFYVFLLPPSPSRLRPTFYASMCALVQARGGWPGLRRQFLLLGLVSLLSRLPAGFWVGLPLLGAEEEGDDDESFLAMSECGAKRGKSS